MASEAEFERLLEDVSIEASHAVDPWYLLKGLDAATDEHAMELNHTLAFWRVTFKSLHEAVLSHLGRLYDKTPGSLSLGSFLETAKVRAGYFSEEAFRRRLSDNPHLEGLAARARTFDLTVLDSEIESVSDKDGLVKCLHEIRNRRVAHRDGNMVRLAALSSVAGLSVADTDTLLERANNLTTKYSLLYRASCVSTRLHGADDYKDLLQLVKQSIDFNTAEVEKEIRRETLALSSRGLSA